MMDSNNYGNILPVQNYHISSYAHQIPHPISNEYYYKEYTPCSSDVSAFENPTLKAISPCQKPPDTSYEQKKARKLARVKRKFSNKENSLKATNRLRRLRGESYIDSKGRERPPRLMLPAQCRGKAKHKGCDEVTDDDRKLIYMEFRQLKTNQAQWQFVASHLTIHLKKRNTGGTSEKPSRREYTYIYYLTAKGVKIKVCREFFLSTLNVTESLIKTSLNKLSPQGVCQDDRRGRKTPRNKLSDEDENFIRKHIMSFPSYFKKNSLKKYLDSNLNVSEMHKMYVTSCSCENRKPVSVEKYRLIFKEFGLMFMKKKEVKSRRAKVNNTSIEESNIVSNQSFNLPTQQHNEYQPNGECLGQGIGNENFSLPTFLIGVEPTKDFNEKRINSETGQEYATFYSRSNFGESTNCQTSSNLCITNKQSEKGCSEDQDKTFVISAVLSIKNKKLVPKSKSVISRLKKLRGESYVDSKGRDRPARPMKPAFCRGKNKHHGCDQVTDEDRSSIYFEFRQLSSYQAQWQFVASHVTVQSKRRCTSLGPSRREKTFVYYLTARGERFKVCREFFLSTLSVTESLVKTSVNKLSPQGICQEDKRGRQTPKNKLNPLTEEYLQRHILSFPTTVRKNSTKLFLDSNLSIVEMHRMYMAKCAEDGLKHVSVEKYRMVCKEFNLAIPKIKKPRTNKSNSTPYLNPQVFNTALQTNCATQYDSHYVGNGMRGFSDFEDRTFKNASDNSNVVETDFRTLLYMPERS